MVGKLVRHCTFCSERERIRRQYQVKRERQRIWALELDHCAKDYCVIRYYCYCCCFCCCRRFHFKWQCKAKLNGDPILYMFSNFFFFALDRIKKKQQQLCSISTCIVSIKTYWQKWREAARRLPLLINSTSNFICIGWPYDRSKRWICLNYCNREIFRRCEECIYVSWSGLNAQQSFGVHRMYFKWANFENTKLFPNQLTNASTINRLSFDLLAPVTTHILD